MTNSDVGEREAPHAPRLLRVFVSSTFHDMQGERDALIKYVALELRAVCEPRGFSFEFVDLRWGITEVESERGEVLPICLAEIEHSRPFFIGLLGDRYGWAPDLFPAEALQRAPWLAEHLGSSVTEIETVAGALRDPRPDAAFFYFRATDGGSLDQRVARLRERIRASGLTVHEYQAVEDFGRKVRDDMMALVEPLYPVSEVAGPYRYSTPEDHLAVMFTIGLFAWPAIAERCSGRALDVLNLYPGGWEAWGAEGLKHLHAKALELSRFYGRALDAGATVICGPSGPDLPQSINKFEETQPVSPEGWFEGRSGQDREIECKCRDCGHEFTFDPFHGERPPARAGDVDIKNGRLVRRRPHVTVTSRCFSPTFSVLVGVDVHSPHTIQFEVIASHVAAISRSAAPRREMIRGVFERIVWTRPAAPGHQSRRRPRRRFQRSGANRERSAALANGPARAASTPRRCGAPQAPRPVGSLPSSRTDP